MGKDRYVHPDAVYQVPVKGRKKTYYWVIPSEKGFTVCDNDGCDDTLYHEGDTYGDLSSAKMMADFWASGGHWMDVPDIRAIA